MEALRSPCACAAICSGDGCSVGTALTCSVILHAQHWQGHTKSWVSSGQAYIGRDTEGRIGAS
jgi:hypothetical protein